MPFPYPFPIVFGVWPTMAVVTNALIQDVEKGSINVDLQIEERSVARFNVVDLTGVLTFQRGQPVNIYDTTDTCVFGGVIHKPEKVALSPTGGLLHKIKCMDWHYLADKRLVAESYTNKTCGFIVDDIFDKYLDEEGVTIGNIELGATLIEAVFNYVRASDAFDKLAEAAGKVWFIDELKALYFQDRDTTAAPWNATTDEMLKGTPKWSGANPRYRNRQYIRGGRDITAPQTEVFIGVAGGVEDKVAFTVGYPIAELTSVTVTNRVPPGQTFGLKGIDTAKKCYWSKGDPVVTFVDPPENGETVTIVYVGQYDILALVQNDDEVAAQLAIEGAGTGYVEAIDDETTLTDKDAILDAGKAKIASFGVPSARFLYTTIRTGLKPGQLQPINYPTLGVNNEEMLIERVVLEGKQTLINYKITAVQGPAMGSWEKIFKTLASQKDEIMDRLNVGSNQILLILVESSEDLELSEVQTETVYACTTCGGALPVVNGTIVC